MRTLSIVFWFDRPTINLLPTLPMGLKNDLSSQMNKSKTSIDNLSPLPSIDTIRPRDETISTGNQQHRNADDDMDVNNISQKPAKRPQLTYSKKMVIKDSAVIQRQNAISAQHRAADDLAVRPITHKRKDTANMSLLLEPEPRVKRSKATHASEVDQERESVQSLIEGISESEPRGGSGTKLRWAIDDVRREGFTDDALPIEILNWAQEQMVEFDRRRATWTKATGADGGPVCAQAYSRKKPTRWTNKRHDIPCKACSKRKTLCLIVQDGDMDILGFEIGSWKGFGEEPA